MEKIYRQSKLRYVNLAIVFLQSYLLNCAFQGKLLFLDIFFKENICGWILKYSFWILVILTLGYLVNYYFIDRRSKENVATVVYDNICKEIFRRFIKPKSVSYNLMRVSLLKAFDREGETPYLRVVGRYQTKSPKRRSKLKFNVGEGCAGHAYETGNIVQKTVTEYNPRNPSIYYDESENTFQLNRNKARHLNDKACDFLCVPVRFFGEDEPWGVLSVDSMKKGTFSSEEVREIESVLSCFSVFLML